MLNPGMPNQHLFHESTLYYIMSKNKSDNNYGVISLCSKHWGKEKIFMKYLLYNMLSEHHFHQVILAGTLTGAQGDIRCKVLAALSQYNTYRKWSNERPLSDKRTQGGGELSNVGYTGMCHRPGSILHFQKSRAGPGFWSFTPEQVLITNVLLQNRILFWQSGLKRQKCQLLSWKMTGPIPIFL